MSVCKYFTIEENMKGKAAFMTGGTMGIGRACVETFIQAGVNVTFVGRSRDLGQKIEAELNTLNKGKAVFMECDVTDHDRLTMCIDTAAQTFGRLDTLLNCAGFFLPQGPIDTNSVEDYKRVLECNLVGYFVAAKAALPYLRKVHGSIINMGSVTGTNGQEGCIAYCSTKGGIHTMTKVLAIDESRHGVRVNEVKPGHINTEMFFNNAQNMQNPEEFIRYSDSLQWLGRGGEPDEIGRVVLFLASDWASFITGEEIHVTGGYEIGEGPKVRNPYLAKENMEDKMVLK